MSDSATRTRRQLGDILIANGVVSVEQLQTALEEQARTKRRLGDILVESGTLFPGDLYKALADQQDIEVVDLDNQRPDPIFARKVPEPLARRIKAVALSETTDGKLRVAMAEPFDVFAIDDLRAATGSRILPVLGSQEQLERVINSIYEDGKAEEAVRNAADAMGPGDNNGLSEMGELTDDGPIVRFIDLLLKRAIQERASDIHVEAAEDGLRIRFRVDGVLKDVMRSPKSVQSGVLSRFKIIAELDIAEKRVPQDGRTSVKIGDRVVDLRVVTVPTVYGESVVLRILDQGTNSLDIDDLGMHPRARKRFEWAYNKPAGGVLVTGPTGSGKTTTLYSTLNALNDPTTAIVTVEDPVEYRIDGIKQMQMNVKAGLTFASSLRAILRADPDVVLVGEIRDIETAQIAAEAALTGHLVLSTLHTNDSASTPLRLIEMGLEPFMVTASITCIVAQRLARRLCAHCAEPDEPDPADLKAAGWQEGLIRTSDLTEVNWRRPVGCSKCGNSGFKGRFGVHEVLLVSPEIQHMILSHTSAVDIKRQAQKEGMLTMRQDGLIKAAAGMTTIKELARSVA
ncbi:MAG: Flp pilus assembly complex ATPase component [Actinomycetia bacterium]|nr:Flp pilus assembly complex ATPase component [Actinomycetes bacterium]